jgi:hypothetical protein
MQRSRLSNVLYSIIWSGRSWCRSIIPSVRNRHFQKRCRNMATQSRAGFAPAILAASQLGKTPGIILIGELKNGVLPKSQRRRMALIRILGDNATKGRRGNSRVGITSSLTETPQSSLSTSDHPLSAAKKGQGSRSKSFHGRFLITFTDSGFLLLRRSLNVRSG